MDKTIDERMENILQDDKITQEQLEFFENRLYQNSIEADSKLIKSLFLFIITSTAWFMIKSATINELSIFGMEFVDPSVPLLILPPIAAFFYYRFHCENRYSTLIDKVLRKYYSENFKPLYNNFFTDLMMAPTFIDIEIVFKCISGNRNSLFFKTSNAWLQLLSLMVFIIPLFLLLWMSYFLLTSPLLGIALAIVSTVLVLLFLTKSLLVFFIKIN